MSENFSLDSSDVYYKKAKTPSNYRELNAKK